MAGIKVGWMVGGGGVGAGVGGWVGWGGGGGICTATSVVVGHTGDSLLGFKAQHQACKHPDFAQHLAGGRQGSHARHQGGWGKG